MQRYSQQKSAGTTPQRQSGTRFHFEIQQYISESIFDQMPSGSSSFDNEEDYYTIEHDINPTEHNFGRNVYGQKRCMNLIPE